jgi:hypothetical protein
LLRFAENRGDGKEGIFDTFKQPVINEQATSNMIMRTRNQLSFLFRPQVHVREAQRRSPDMDTLLMSREWLVNMILNPQPT